ncbi:MAG: hypothetical protein M1511_06365 [Deltaproteobacteria bacterium]|nr:hypothetical protein [Deltaproteobacteria bacterium]
MKRLVTIITAVIFSVICTTLPLYAQWLPRNFSADTSLRVEYLLGTQTLGSYNNTPLLNSLVTVNNPSPPPPELASVNAFPNPIELMRIDFNEHLMVLDGVAELTPARMPSLSARGRGSASVFNPDKSVSLSNGPSPVPNGNNLTPPPPATNYGWNEVPSSITPKFWLWEVAGLYNFYESIYRYSLVGGYRQETWSYLPSSNQGSSSYFKDNFVSQIPFIGMQTVMFCPTWKARFEMLGSLFMTKKISHSARGDNGYMMQLDGNMTQGGFLEFQAEGNVKITPAAWAGLYTQYTFESLRGVLTGVSPDGSGEPTYVPTPYNFYTLRNTWVLGLNCNVPF